MHKRYDRYKDSGVEWIGEVPEHWGKSKLKYLIRSIESGSRGLGGGNIGSGVFSIGGEHITWDGEILTSPSKFITGDYYSKLNSGKVKCGDTLLVKDGATIGKTAYVDKKPYEKCAVNEHVYILRANNKISSKLLYYLVSGNLGFEQIKLEMRGAAQPGLNYGFTNKVLVPSIPLRDQKAIANYLDNKTSEIESLIADKEELIKKLGEYKQSIITEAVTKGLHPDVKMKDSGIEWIGEIPEHWDLKKVKHLSSYIGSGKTPRGGSEIYKDSGILFLRSQNIYSYGLKLTDKVYISEEIDSDMRNTRVRNLDVLLNITGASIGRSSIVPEGFPRSNVNQHVCIIRPLLNKVIPSLLHKNLISKSVQDQIFMHQTGSSREGLNFVQVANLMLVMPPTISEQEELSNYLGERIASLETLIAEILDSIKMLISFRHALIYEAVTGKIDVRDYEPERSEQLA